MDFYKRQVPDKLYKYMEPGRVDVLTTSRVRYTPLGGFNDPFEGWPEIASIGTEEQISEIIDAVFPEEIRRGYEQLDPRAQAMLPFEVWRTMVTDVARDKKPQLLAQAHELLPYASKWMRAKVDGLLGAFCLSEVPDSLLMWAHYSSSHTGFVIEYNAHHPYFHQQTTNEDELRHLRRVLYREARPSVPAMEMSGPLMFLTKSGHWSYEREWRLLRPLEDAALVIDGLPPVHLFDVPPDAVTAIILGCRCSPETTKAIRDGLSANPIHNHVQLRRAREDPTHFLLRIESES